MRLLNSSAFHKRGCKRPHDAAHANRRRGQSLIEFSLVMPVLLLVVTGMVGFGLALYNNLVLTNGVNIGAQTLASSRGQTTDPCATASAAVQSAAPSLVAANLSYTIILNGTSYTSTSCSSATLTQGTTIQVSATYPCSLPVYGMNGICHLGAATAEVVQ